MVSLESSDGFEDKSSLKYKGPSLYPTIDHITISPPGVLKILSELDVPKATGPDRLPARRIQILH